MSAKQVHRMRIRSVDVNLDYFNIGRRNSGSIYEKFRNSVSFFASDHMYVIVLTGNLQWQ